MTDKTGGSAFPVNDTYHGGIGNIERGEPGMTLRDYFAAKALQGYFAARWTTHQVDTDATAKYCYEMADAMLAARELGE